MFDPTVNWLRPAVDRAYPGRDEPLKASDRVRLRVFKGSEPKARLTGLYLEVGKADFGSKEGFYVPPRHECRTLYVAV